MFHSVTFNDVANPDPASAEFTLTNPALGKSKSGIALEQTARGLTCCD